MCFLRARVYAYALSRQYLIYMILVRSKHEGASREHLPVTVAAVTLPVNDRGDILVTQRAYRGMDTP